MSSAASPKQGDHVFNALDSALMRPFETIASLRSPLADGQHFIHDYLLYSYSLAREIAASRMIADVRKHVATTGADEDAVRELTKLQSRVPALARINAAVLRTAHQRNAEQFGEAAAHYEAECLRAVLHALQAAVAPAPNNGRQPSPGIAYQQMLSSAYDPAAALVVIANSMAREAVPQQAAFHTILAGIANSLDKPGLWREPFDNFRDDRAASATRTIISDIRSGLLTLDQLKARSATFGAYIRDEIAQKSSWAHAAPVFGAMLNLLHGRLLQNGIVHT